MDIVCYDLPRGTLLGNALPNNVVDTTVFLNIQLSVQDEFLAFVEILDADILQSFRIGMRFGTLHEDGVEYLFVTVVIRLVGHDFDTVACDVEAAVTRAARLTETRGEEAPQVLHIMVLVVE